MGIDTFLGNVSKQLQLFIFSLWMYEWMLSTTLKNSYCFRGFKELLVLYICLGSRSRPCSKYYFNYKQLIYWLSWVEEVHCLSLSKCWQVKDKMVDKSPSWINGKWAAVSTGVTVIRTAVLRPVQGPLLLDVPLSTQTALRLHILPSLWSGGLR